MLPCEYGHQLQDLTAFKDHQRSTGHCCLYVCQRRTTANGTLPLLSAAIAALAPLNQPLPRPGSCLRPFPCRYCKRSFKATESLRQHCLASHPGFTIPVIPESEAASDLVNTHNTGADTSSSSGTPILTPTSSAASSPVLAPLLPSITVLPVVTVSVLGVDTPPRSPLRCPLCPHKTRLFWSSAALQDHLSSSVHPKSKVARLPLP